MHTHRSFNGLAERWELLTNLIIATAIQGKSYTALISTSRPLSRHYFTRRFVKFDKFFQFLFRF